MQGISVIVPVFNEKDSIELFCNEITKILDMIDITYEIIFVDDGSTDNGLEIIKRISQKSDRIEYISFSRNFGKEAAIIAGLTYSHGEYVSIMDVDLQDPPSMLAEMYCILQRGEYDCVAARRVTRTGEPVIRSFFANIFYKLINKISEVPIVEGARDFRLMTRQMVDAICALPEYNRFSKGLFQWVGFHTYWLPYENVERTSGTTKWSFWKLFIYSIEGIVAFSTVPLALSSMLGVIISIFAFCFGIYFMMQKIFIGISVPGYAAIMVIILMLGGLQLLSIGILGQYMAKAYLEVKKRPHYVIKEKAIEAVKYESNNVYANEQN